MKRARTWTRLGAALLCVSALGCEEADGPLILRSADAVETEAGVSDASDAGTTSDDPSDVELGGEARSEGRARDEDAEDAEREQGGRHTGIGGAGGGSRSHRGDAEWRPSDAQIGKLLYVANKVEIAQANAVLPMLSDARIRAFATHMVEAHGAAQARQSALLKSLGLEPIASVLSSNLEYESAGVLARLEKATSGEIDRLYIDSQVTLHSKALDTLEEVLLPNAQDSNLWTEVSNTRDEVRAHVEEADALAEALAGKP